MRPTFSPRRGPAPLVIIVLTFFQSQVDQHFQTTTLLIKAFNHKFHLDLELNKYCWEMHNFCALPIYP